MLCRYALLAVFLVLVGPVDIGAQTGAKVAFVVGNDAYARAPLRNARNDARAIQSVLAELGFKVHLVLDATNQQLNQAVDTFVREVQPGDIALTFYAGHGMQLNGDNYLLPVDFNAEDEAEVRYQAYSATRLYERIAEKRPDLQVLVLDACRDNPYRSTRSTTRGLAPLPTTTGGRLGSFVAFSTGPGEVASDNSRSINSVFTSQLVDAMLRPNVGLDAMFLRVRQNVARLTAGRQKPWTHSSLLEDYRFRPAAPLASAASDDKEFLYWEIVNGVEAPELLESYLQHYPRGVYASVARQKLEAAREARPVVITNSRRPSIVVDTFRNLSNDRDRDWIGRALAETLKTDLAIGEGIRIASPEEEAVWRATAPPPDGNRAAIATSADDAAEFALTGTYLVSGAAGQRQLRINSTLSRRGSAEPVAVLTASAQEDQLLDLVAREGQRIRNVLKLPSNPADVTLSAAMPAAPASSRLYAEAVDKLRRHDALGASEVALKLTAQEPELALGFATLSEAWYTLGFDAKAMEAADSARALADRLPREQRLVVDAQYFRAHAEWSKLIDVWRALAGFYPDNIEYSLQLADAYLNAGQPRVAVETVRTLRKQFVSSDADPRVDLLDARASRAASQHAEAQALAVRAAQRATAMSALDIAANAHLTAALALEALSQINRARANNDEARRLFGISGNRSGLAGALLQLGANSRVQKDESGAEAFFREALDISRQIGDRRRTSAALNNLANLALAQGQLDNARQYYEQALAVYREIQSKSGIAVVLNNIASLLVEQGKLDEAAPLDAEALRLRREIGSPRPLATSLANIAETTLDRGELQTSANLYLEAQALFAEIGDEVRLAYVLRGLAQVQLWQGVLSAGRDSATRALDLATRAKNSDTSAEAEVILARLDLADRRCDDAVARLQRIRPQLRSSTDIPATAAAALVESYLCLGDRTAAEKTASEAQPKSPRAAFEVAIARARLAGSQTAPTQNLLKEARQTADQLGSRFLALRVDVVELELTPIQGRTPDRIETLLKRAALAGAGLLTTSIQGATRP